MKKIISIIFIIACLLMCVIPFAGMAFETEDRAIGNEVKTELPSFKTQEGKFNTEYFQQLGDYFSSNFFLRPDMIFADAKIQAEVFSGSNLDSVVVGKNDWLYYSSTLDNYLGRNLMSQRDIFNTVNNLSIVNEYLCEKGIDFLFAVASNKNSLYPENMPYYLRIKENKGSDLKAFTDAVKNSEVNYFDLYDLLSSEDEILYHIQDSHWNNKGALIAYNAILDKIGKYHDDFSDVKITRSKNFYGDLGKMIYTDKSEPEYNYEYDIDFTFDYVTPTKSVEEAIIVTSNPQAEESLYMYRDSFGNAPLPFFAQAFNSACFTKMFPISLDSDLETNPSDTVIFLIAERNLGWFTKTPPVIPSPQVDEYSKGEVNGNISDLKTEISSADMRYVCVTGAVESESLTSESEMIVCVSDETGFVGAFEAYTTSTDKSDYSFMSYIPVEYLASEKLDISVIIKNGTEFTSTDSLSSEIQEPEI